MKRDQQQEYERIIRPLESRMIQSAWRITGNSADAEDVFQEALIKIWKHWNSLVHHPNPQALVLRICANAAYDLLRRQRRRKKMEGDEEPVPDQTPSPESPPFQQIADRKRQHEVFHAIGGLSRKQAQSILMHVVDERSYGEIAEALGCGEATVRKHVARARARLRTLLIHLKPVYSMEVLKNE